MKMEYKAHFHLKTKMERCYNHTDKFMKFQTYILEFLVSIYIVPQNTYKKILSENCYFDKRIQYLFGVIFCWWSRHLLPLLKYALFQKYMGFPSHQF